MYFNDNFDYTEKELNDIVVFNMLKFLIAHNAKANKKQGTVFFTSNLIEYVLKKLNITSFDFLNEASKALIEKSLREAITFLEDEKIITNKMSETDEFYKFFIRKQLFSRGEFSSEFEHDFIEKLIYKIDVYFKYSAISDVETFYETYKAYKAYTNSTKTITIKIDKDYIDVVVLMLKVEEIYLRKALKKYNLSGDLRFFAYYNYKTKKVELYTSKANEKRSLLYKKLLLILNLDTKIKQNFIYIKQ